MAIKGRRFPIQQPRLGPYAVSLPPSAPTGLSVVNDATNPTAALDLSWNAVSGATSYNVLQAGTLGGTFGLIESGITGTSYVVAGLASGTEFAFEVEAVNGSGTSSPSSAVAWATEAAAPTSLSATLTSTSASVSFTHPSIGGTVGFTFYAYRYEFPVGAGNWVTGTASTSFSPSAIPGLNPLTQYGIEIATVINSVSSDFAGSIQGPWSSELTVITPAFGSLANVIQAGPKNPVSGKQRKVIQPILSRSIESGIPPGVPTPNYTGFVILAKQKGIRSRVRDCVVYAPPVIGAPPPSISLPRYTGLFVRPLPWPRAQYRHRLSKLRLTPAGGFVGAKLAFLTVTPTRKATNFTVTPTRQANLTVQ